MPRFRLAAFAAALAAAAAPLPAQELTLVTWGGAYEQAQKRAVIAPFEDATGATVTVREYDGTRAALAARARDEGWDVVDMLADTAGTACAEGLLQPLDAAAILGSDAARDFAPMAPTRCALPQNVYARVIAYDERAFPGVKPSRVEHFFDTARFPGPRAAARTPDGLLEWALMADGVPPAQVYSLLSTDRGLRLALRRLDAVRDAVTWVDGPAGPARALAQGDAVMAAGFNGRFFDAAQARGAPINIIWDGRIIGVDVWAVPASSDAPELARRFLEHALSPETMARLSERIPYGPARVSAFERIGLNPDTGVPMRVHLPNAPSHGARSLVRDPDWYANTSTLRRRRFEAWLGRDD